jgi:DNA-directed RNA polymerase subunit beta'
VIKERPVYAEPCSYPAPLGHPGFRADPDRGQRHPATPLVTTAFNADFDGDQMAVHVPLSQKAVWEARNLMLSSKNLFKPADGEPIISPSKDMVLGVYYLTTLDESRPHKGDGRHFSDLYEAELAYQLGHLEIKSNIFVRTQTWYADDDTRLMQPEERIIKTTLGRVLFNLILPEEIQFMNHGLEKGGLKDLMAELYEVGGEDQTPDIADRIKAIGFEYATRSGYTMAVSDITVPEEKSRNHRLCPAGG